MGLAEPFPLLCPLTGLPATRRIQQVSGELLIAAGRVRSVDGTAASRRETVWLNGVALRAWAHRAASRCSRKVEAPCSEARAGRSGIGAHAPSDRQQARVGFPTHFSRLPPLWRMAPSVILRRMGSRYPVPARRPNPAARQRIATAGRGFGGAISCFAVAQQRHKIIRNGVALRAEESVSGVTSGSGPLAFIRNPTHAHLHHRQ